ncbi:uracil-xanthine permease family protein [Methanospirillum lacunae]|uniref:uracil-xanthine permease family protein n=1 Tax=Methanospirillum lacunae TaxID=668570 RepID=UPI0015E8493F|nr:solute carrier family 23 protein [Methanospirillum lacunae]
MTYTTEEIPPPVPCFLLGLQHALLIATSFVFPLILIRASGMGTSEAGFFLSMTIMAVGIGTILQSLKGHYIGSGFLCPSFAALFFIPPATAAYALGGLGLMSAMTAMSGVFQIAISRVISRLRFLFPPEVTGLVIIMAGISAIPFSIQSFLGMENLKAQFISEDLLIAIITLGVIVIASIWGKGSMKLYPAFIGIIAGYIAAFFCGQIPTSSVFTFLTFPLIELPKPIFLSWSFDSSILLPFIIAAFAGVFKTIGNLTSCQKINDADWIRSDMENYSRGTLTEGVTNIICGAIGGLGQSTSSGNIGLSLATGATSRRIGIIAGIILVFLAVFPPVSSFFLIMPLPVIGAALVYSICYMVMTGMEVMMTRMMDTRRFFTIGISLVFGFGASTFSSVVLPIEYSWLATILTSPLTLSTIIAILLTLVFRIGIKQQATIKIMPGDENLADTVFSFIDQNARMWGARRDVATKAGSALLELMESGFSFEIFNTGATVTLSFDEYNFDILVEYQGDPITIPEDVPSHEELMEDPDSFLQLALALVRKHSDSLSVTRSGEMNKVFVHFEH